MGFSLKVLSEIADAQLRGDPERFIDRVAPLQDAGPGAISFLANKKYKTYLKDTQASAVICSAEDAEDCPVDCLISDNPYLAHARAMTLLYPTGRSPSGVHHSSVVEASAKIAASASVGPNCYVGANVTLEDDVVIGPGCTVLDRTIVGAGSRLVAMVTLCTDTRLGKRCLIHPGAVIGSDGFGLANDNGAWVKVPQIGRAILGDDVEVGACTSVDRGAIGDTVIAHGVKLDNQVHVAHNVKIGEHAAIAGCSAIAGSSELGAYCTMAGGSALSGHISVADHVHVSGYTAITRSIRKPGILTSLVPAMDHAAWLKNFARLRQLDDMARRIKALEKDLETLRGKDDAQG